MKVVMAVGDGVSVVFEQHTREVFCPTCGMPRCVDVGSSTMAAYQGERMIAKRDVKRIPISYDDAEEKARQFVQTLDKRAGVDAPVGS